MSMTRDEFRARWDSGDGGGGITGDDIAECAQAWGLYPKPRIRPMGEVTAAVLGAAGVEVPPTLAACGHPVTDRQDLHWSDQLEDEVCPDCCQECNR